MYSNGAASPVLQLEVPPFQTIAANHGPWQMERHDQFRHFVEEKRVETLSSTVFHVEMALLLGGRRVFRLPPFMPSFQHSIVECSAFL